MLDTALLKQALDPYKQAIARDPSFALALARLSYVQSLLAWFGGRDIDVGALTAEARENAERALALNPKLADAYIARGFSEYYSRRDYDAALASFATAQRLRPNDAGAMAAAGYVYRRLGRIDDSIRKLEEALDHDPRNSRITNNLAVNYMMVRRYADAERAYRRALALDPDNVAAKLFLSDAILSRTGDPAQALPVLEGGHPLLQLQRAWGLRYQHHYPDAIAVVESIPDTPDVFGGQMGPSKAATLGGFYLDMGDAARARQYYRRAEGGTRRTLAEIEADATADGNLLASALLNMADVELGLDHIEAALRLAGRGQAVAEGLDDDYLIQIYNIYSADLYSRARRADLAVPLLDRVLASPTGGAAYSPAGLPTDPSWDPIRQDPRFIALLRKYPASSVEGRGDEPRGTSIPVR